MILPDVLENLSENKNSIKEDAIKCINKTIKRVGFDFIINFFGIYLKVENFDIRNEILKIILEHKDKISNQKEYIDLLKPLINCLLDKNSIIRNLSKSIIQEIMKVTSNQLVTEYITKLNPSYRETISDILFKIKIRKFI